MRNKVIPFPTSKRPQSARLDAVTLAIHPEYYGRLVRFAALVDMTASDLVNLLLEKEFGKEPQPPTSHAA
jgi:hypothetical protein